MTDNSMRELRERAFHLEARVTPDAAGVIHYWLDKIEFAILRELALRVESNSAGESYTETQSLESILSDINALRRRIGADLPF